MTGRPKSRLPGSPRLPISAGLALLALAVFARTAGHPFVDLDDPSLIAGNPQVAGGLTWRGVAWAFTAVSGDSFWHPLTWLSFMADVSLFGMNAGGHHLVSALIHAANAVLLFLVLSRATGFPWRAAFVAALFAVHPLHVESVAWAAERKDVLSTLFLFLALRAYVRYAEAPRPRRLVPVALGLALSLMAKPMGVTFPFVLLLLDWWPLRRIEGFAPGDGPPRFPAVPLRRALLEKAPLLPLVAASAALTLAFGEPSWTAPPEAIPFGARLANAALAYVAYLRKTLWPLDLAAFYPHPATLPGGIPAGKATAAALLLAGATAAALACARRRPWLAAGWLFYLGTLVPVLGLLQAGGQAMADRYTYVPLTGIFWIAAWGGAELRDRWRVPRRAAAGAAAALLALLSALAVRQAGYWSSTGALFAHAVAVTGDNWVARGELGVAAIEAGRYAEAAAQLREAVRLAPGAPILHNNLGIALDRMGRGAEATAAYEAELRIFPGSVEANHNLGLHLLEAGRPAEAAARFREALRLAPGYAPARQALGRALAAGAPAGGR